MIRYGITLRHLEPGDPRPTLRRVAGIYRTKETRDAVLADLRLTLADADPQPCWLPREQAAIRLGDIVELTVAPEGARKG